VRHDEPGGQQHDACRISQTCSAPCCSQDCSTKSNSGGWSY
jgi:hypothetical protein